ncbi:hypothetical protein BCh11DRAFT_00280 [Burkholderia sp. Ch1-1]|nr:hypothetical protein BCh11DRAFT_00280 [Burkholderia sp. Ch1-1]
MVNDLTPICKALIGLFAVQREPLNITKVERLLPHADPEVMRDTLQMLVRTDVVRQAMRRIVYGREQELVYWLAGNDVGSFAGTQLHYPPSSSYDATLADVAGITRRRENPMLEAGDAHELRILRVAQKAITLEIERVSRGEREPNHA